VRQDGPLSPPAPGDPGRVAEAVGADTPGGDCSQCGAKLRARRLARILLDLYPIDGRPARSMAEWVESEEVRSLRVAEFNRVEGLHEILVRLPRFEASDYRDGAEPGSVVEGVRSEDLTRLTYPDAAFDLVITSETLEHVPDLDAALREIRRVLAPGGRHVFTIPLLPGVPLTFARARLEPDGTKVDLAPPICHPGGDVGYPVFTEFGADFPDLVRAAGFEVEVRFGPTTEDDVAQVYVARRVN
jgi:SAM-dependent methyltransferase